MARKTGTYRITRLGVEEVRAFVPAPLPPGGPPLMLDTSLAQSLNAAMTALGQLSVAAEMVSSPEWFLYGFIRKEALITSQIEGTQATLQDVLVFEAGQKAQRPDDVQEVCNYVAALNYARREIARPRGLPLCTRLLCEAHRRLMRGARGSDKQPGEIRQSQNWIGGSRPGNARFVPPPPGEVAEAMSALQKWIHATDPLPPLIRAGLAHVQFETIHPFLDGNGRIGRLLIALLVEHWGLLKSPLLYLSVAFKRHRQEYYQRLSAVRTDGDWEGWTRYFLDCVREAADDGVSAAQRLFTLISKDRKRLANHPSATVPAIRLFDQLPGHPIITLASAIKLLKVSKPTASKAIHALEQAHILRETTGRLRDRVYAYHAYLSVLTTDTD
jgi:Fic family protein